MPASDGQPPEALLDVRPIALPRPSMLGGVGRLARMSALGARYLLPALPHALGRSRERAFAVALRRLFEHLGATFVKFGQFAASAPGLVGEGVAEEFRTCLDTGPAVSARSVRSIIEADLGRPITELYASFDETPIAAASIAVVHRARLPDGTDVAVKVLRPGIERAIATDLAVLERMMRFWAGLGVEQAYNMVGLVVGLRMQIAEELDLCNEARTMDLFRGLYDGYGLARLVVPRVHHEMTARRVLTMELLDGAPLDDLSHAAALGVDPAPLVRELLKAWVLSGLRVGVFHADIHAGNLLLLRDGRLGMLDWGIVAQMDEDSRRMFRSLCLVSLGVEEAWEDVARLMIAANGPSFYALGLNDDDIRRFTRATFEPVLTHPLRDVSMAELMMSGDDVIQRATGEAPARRSLGDRWRSMRVAAAAYRTASDNGAFESPTMRMGFLSMKQLVYLERYGRMYIPDEALLGDSDFVRRALDGATEVAAG